MKIYKKVFLALHNHLILCSTSLCAGNLNSLEINPPIKVKHISLLYRNSKNAVLIDYQFARNHPHYWQIGPDNHHFVRIFLYHWQILIPIIYCCGWLSAYDRAKQITDKGVEIEKHFVVFVHPLWILLLGATMWNKGKVP